MTTDVEIVHPAPGAVRRLRDALIRARVTAYRTTDAALAGWRLPALIFLAATAVRFIRLGSPPTIVPLDETYYAPNSYGYMCHGADMAFADNTLPHTCDKLEPTFVVHPPVAKLIMSLGIRLFGYDAFGWRSMAALFGSLSVLVIYLIGRRLWESRWLAAAAAVLLGVEGLQFVQSRLAMLDIFLSFFILLGIWLMLEDRKRASGWRGPRWWRLGSGVAFGLAVASKWSGAFLLPVVFAVGLAWEVVRLRPSTRRPETDAGIPESAEPLEIPAPPEAGPLTQRRRPGDSLAFQLFALGATFALIPVLVYAASYTPWFLSTKRYVPPLCHNTVTVAGESRSVPKAGADLWLCNQKEMFNYHKNLRATDDKGKPIHPYMSRAWSWPWISRPAAHYYTVTCAPNGTPEPCRGSQIRQDKEILGLPNPVIWWTAFFIALPLCIWWMVVRRDEVSALLLVLLLPLVLPWLPQTRPLFMFYMTPAAPLLVLMVVHVMKVWKMRVTAVAFVALAVAAFAYFYPVLAAYPVHRDGIFGWQSRIWFGHVLRGDCVQPTGEEGVKLLCWI